MVVDSFSTDRTVEIAKEYTGFIIKRKFDYPSFQKNWAIPQATHQWILLVDADERVTPELKNEVLETLTFENDLNFSDIVNSTADLDSDNAIAQRRTRASSRSKYKYSAGLDSIDFGWIKDENEAISSVLGFNVGLGVGYRKYFKPVKEGKFNFS